MALRNLIANVVAKVVDPVTKDLNSDVTIEHVIGVTGSGKKTYLDPVTIGAKVDWKQKQVRTEAGVLTVSRAHIIFTNVADLERATGGEGLDDDDRITLQDGTTGPILDMGGFIDRATGRPFATEVFLG